MEFILKIIFVLVLVGVAAYIAHIVDIVRSKEGTSDKISFKESMDLTNLPIITLVIDKVKLNFVLDTGSTSSVVDKTVIEGNNISYTHIKNTTLFGLEGEGKEVCVGNFKASYKDREYELLATIKDMSKPFNIIKNNTGVNISGLLGSDFFEKYKYIIDFDKLIAYSMCK